MALVDCPDCGTQVSDRASACPNCARPRPGLADGESAGEVVGAWAQGVTTRLGEVQERAQGLSRRKVIAWLVIGGLVALLGVNYATGYQRYQEVVAERFPRCTRDSILIWSTTTEELTGYCSCLRTGTFSTNYVEGPFYESPIFLALQPNISGFVRNDLWFRERAECRAQHLPE